VTPPTRYPALTAALIAFLAANTRVGDRTRRREPVLDAMPEEA
jgi:hypothetical protein